MLKFYLSTVAIYAIVISCSCILLKDKIAENGWINGISKINISKGAWLFCMSAVPVFRLIIVIAVFEMARSKKGETFWEKQDND